nr:gustatory receptor 20 [Papilio glaucus]
MSPKNIKVNNLVASKNKPENQNIDHISKMFIILQTFLGLNHIRVLNNVHTVVLKCSFTHCVCFHTTLWYFIFKCRPNIYISSINIVSVIGFLSCSILGIMFSNKLCEFFENINTFNLIAGYKSKIDESSIKNARLCVIFIIFQCVMNGVFIYLKYLSESEPYLVIIYLVFTIELFFYAHLLSLLLLRIQFLKRILSPYFLDDKINKFERKTRGHMKTYEKRELGDIVLFYVIIIKAFDNLNAAIKHQFLCILLVTFFTCVIRLDLTMMQVYAGDRNLWALAFQAVNLFIKLILPFLSPCFYASRINKEINYIRDQLITYLRKLDKNSRRPAKTLLKLTRTRSLSFSVFRMLQVDMLLPLKLSAFIVNYLIILLQFQKVTGLQRY